MVYDPSLGRVLTRQYRQLVNPVTGRPVRLSEISHQLGASPSHYSNMNNGQLPKRAESLEAYVILLGLNWEQIVANHESVRRAYAEVTHYVDLDDADNDRRLA
jgi:hypothetical protein